MAMVLGQSLGVYCDVQLKCAAQCAVAVCRLVRTSDTVYTGGAKLVGAA